MRPTERLRFLSRYAPKILGIILAFLLTPRLPANAADPEKPSASEQKSSSPVTPVNRLLPKWLRLGGEFRDRAEGRTAYGFRPGVDDAYDLTRARLSLEITPRDWVRGFFQVQDARVLGIDRSRVTPALKDVFDLRQGYVEFTAGEKTRLNLRIGRQELIFGTERLVGALDWGNTARSFDAARLTLSSARARVDVFASSVVNININSFDKPLPGQNLYGVYGSLKDIVPQSTLEPYVLWKTLPRARDELGASGDADIVTTGARFVGQLPRAFDYALEGARQEGHFASEEVSAWAIYGIGGLTAVRLPLKPRFSAEYDFATGDRSRTDGKISTFDQLYPTNHSYYGIADQVGWRNIKDFRSGVEVHPHAKLKITFDHHFFWLASAHDGLYNASGVLVVRPPASGALHTDVGREADIFAAWSPMREVTIGTGFGHLFPGRFLKENSPGSSTSFPYAFLTYRF